MAQNVEDRDRHRVVGTCVVYRKDQDGKFRYPVIKRRPDLKVYPGLWTVAGGGMERSSYENLPKSSPDGWENPLDAALREEIREEVGVEVGDLEYVSNFTFIRPDDVPVFGVRFMAPHISGEARFDPEDSTELRWATADEMHDLEFLGKVAEEIREIDAILTSRS